MVCSRQAHVSIFCGISQDHLVLIINISQCIYVSSLNFLQMKSHALSHLCKSYQIEKESDTFTTRLDFYLQKKDFWNGETWWINSCLFKNSMGARKVDPIRVSSLKCMMNVKVHFWNSLSKINSQVQCQRSCNMLLLLSVLPNDKRPYRVYF